MITAAGEAATKGGTGGADKIGDSANNGAQADAGSVNGIAKGIKGIVDAAGKALGEKDALAGVAAAAGGNDANKEAGKLFGTGAANAGDIKKAAAAVSAVSGEQILKAIVDAAGDTDQAGKKAEEAKNPIAAAIGTANAQGAAFGNDEMKKRNDNIAAAIVLRGVAKDGKFAGGDNDDAKASVKSAVDEVSAWLGEMITAAGEAATKGGTGADKIGDSANNGAQADKGSVKEIAKGIKGIVDAAGKALGEKDALAGVAAAAGENEAANADAGKLFGTAAAGNAGDDDIKKAAAAVSAVSGEQILKAIVEAAGDTDQEGEKAGAAKNPIAAAIGTAGAAAAFGNDEMKKRNDNIAAAIVLRGVAKGGKFAVAGGANDANVKSAVDEVSAWLGEMITAAGEAATKGGTGDGKIGDSDNNGARADADSVKEIAKGIKGIVDAAGKALGEKDALAGVKAAAGGDDANKEAGKLFGTGAANADDIKKAAAAVSAVSGEQILKAIVEAAGDTAQAGAAAGAAKNPIAAAIGNAGAQGAAFGNDAMKKRNDNIAAAIVLRGMAKGGKFAAAANDNAKASVKSAVDEVSAWLGEMITAAGEAAKVGTGGADKIGDSANNGAQADKDSVNGIAKGIKGIVDAAGKALGEKDALAGVKAADKNDANKEAGKLFGTAGAGGDAGDGDIKKAAAAVSAVSGEQILKAIVDAAGDTANQEGKKAEEAKNPIAAAIGNGAAFNQDAMKKRNDNIAAAIVLRGVAKGGKFAVAGGAKASVKSVVDEVSAWLGEMITAAGEACYKGWHW